MHVFGLTDVGRTREHNEDSFLVVDLGADNAALTPDVRTHVGGPRGTLFMVADGLGGAAAGEIASDLAVKTVHDFLRAHWSGSAHDEADAFAAALRGAAEAANQAIYSYALEHAESRGLGTTCTMAGLLGDTVFLAQVGDSRAYLVRNGVARQITKDQSLMQRLVEAGELTPDEAERSERRNIILQALGPEPVVKIDLTYQRLRRGDTLVLCTDGLSGLVKKDEIGEVVSTEADLEQACRELIERANENGGPDNITVILARFDGEGLVDAAADDHVGHAVFPLPGSEGPSAPLPRFEGAGIGDPASDPPNDVLDGTVMPRPLPPNARLWIGALVIAALVLVLILVIGRARRQAPDAAPPADSVPAQLSN